MTITECLQRVNPTDIVGAIMDLTSYDPATRYQYVADKMYTQLRNNLQIREKRTNEALDSLCEYVTTTKITEQGLKQHGKILSVLSAIPPIPSAFLYEVLRG